MYSLMTHNDLDACGCILNLEQKVKFTNIYSTGYYDFDTVVNDILLNCKDDYLIVADVCFSQKKEFLLKLYNKFKKIIFIDHHLYPENFFNDFPNMKVIYDTSKCATLLCNEHFQILDPKLREFSERVNVYDIWVKDDKRFNQMLYLNEYFWKITKELNLREASYKLLNIDVNEYKKWLIDYVETKDLTIREYKDAGIIQRVGELTFVLTRNFFNFILTEEMQKGQEFVIAINHGVFGVRINSSSTLSKQQKDKLRELLTGGQQGHENCFTYKIESSDFESVRNEMKRICECIETVRSLN